MYPRTKSLLIILILALFIAVAGKYAWDYKINHSEEALLRRANEYWEAIRINDLYTAYELEAETAEGNLLPHDVEIRPEWGLKVVQFRLGNVSIDGDVAEIDVTTMLTMMEFAGKTFPGGTKKDVWSYVKGQWFHGVPDIGGSGIRRKPDAFLKEKSSSE